MKINKFLNSNNLFNVLRKLSRSPILCECDRKLDRFGAVPAAGRSGSLLLDGGERAARRRKLPRGQLRIVDWLRICDFYNTCCWEKQFLWWFLMMICNELYKFIVCCWFQTSASRSRPFPSNAAICRWRWYKLAAERVRNAVKYVLTGLQMLLRP